MRFWDASAVIPLVVEEPMTRPLRARFVEDAAMAADWAEVVPNERLRELAVRLLWVHPLRASDALQLVAALAFADRDPKTIAFVTLDDRLGSAAAREGFEVLGA